MTLFPRVSCVSAIFTKGTAKFVVVETEGIVSFLLFWIELDEKAMAAP